MNPRIRELVEQATETFTTYFDGRGNVTETYFDKEKFAELVVRECVRHLHKRGVEGFGILEERNLKEHFGVEE